jgi:hypothetical protein
MLLNIALPYARISLRRKRIRIHDFSCGKMSGLVGPPLRNDEVGYSRQA